MKDWKSYKSGWYSASFTIKSEEQFEELMIWIGTNIPGHRKHTIWSLNGNRLFTIRFRYQKDYEWFMLRWV
jgi:hypothetical protein